jgi:hypothetical protein
MQKSILRPAASLSSFSALLIVYGILRAYLRRPARFMATTMASTGKFRKMAPSSFPEELVRPVSLFAWSYMRLKTSIGREKALEVMRAVFIPALYATFSVAFRTTEIPRTFENLVKLHEFARKNLFSTAKEEVVEMDGKRYEYRSISCGYVDLFSAVGIPELTPVLCAVDHAFYNAYLPSLVTFSRLGISNTLAEGAPFCTFSYENNDAKAPS